jgi:hypothetical protein
LPDVHILVVLKQQNYVRAFAGPIGALAARGHQMCIAFQEPCEQLPPELEGIPNLVFRSVPSKRADAWRRTAPLVRRAADYVRYLEPSYRGAGKLRARAFDKLLHTLSQGTREGTAEQADVLLTLSDAEREQLKLLFEQVEALIPVDPAVVALLEELRPDVLLISPLVDLGSGQSEFVKAARSLGIATGLLLFSWDNLTTKGTLHVHPDRLFVWNDWIKREAIELHGIDPESIVVTGAPRFDPFFDLAPTLTREAFCRPLGFDPAAPIVTYLCSSKFVSGDELTFLRDWVAAIRASGSPLSTANLLVRPHPDVKPAEREGAVTKVRWEDEALGRAWITRPLNDPRAALVRTSGGQPFFECLHHAAAVVGLNTTAELEAAIAGRQVFTIVAPAGVVDGQHTTLHFHYLLAENGGIVHTARDLNEHVAQLARALREPGDTAAIRQFVGRFVRPGGLDRPVSGVMAEAIERAFTTHE